MLIFFIIFIAIIAGYAEIKDSEAKKEQIKQIKKKSYREMLQEQKSYREMLQASEDSISSRRIRFYIYLAIIVVGIFICVNVDDFFALLGGLLVTLVGIICSFTAVAVILSEKKSLKSLRDMKEEGYFQKQVDSICEEKLAAEQAEQKHSFFDKAPTCPLCGSADTRTSDDYRVKEGGKLVTGFLLSSVLGNYTAMNAAQVHYTSGRLKDSIKIDIEYQCNRCGHLWKPIINRRQQLSQEIRQELLREQSQKKQNAPLPSPAKKEGSNLLQKVENKEQTPFTGRRKWNFQSQKKFKNLRNC